MTEQWWHIVWRILLCWSIICLPFVRRDTNQTWAIQWFVFLFLFLPFFHSTVTLCPSLSNTIVVACFAHMYSHQDDDDDKRLQSSPSFFFSFLHKDTHIYIFDSFVNPQVKERREEKGRTFATTAIKFMHIFFLLVFLLFFASIIFSFSVSSH